MKLYEPLLIILFCLGLLAVALTLRSVFGVVF